MMYAEASFYLLRAVAVITEPPSAGQKWHHATHSVRLTFLRANHRWQLSSFPTGRRWLAICLASNWGVDCRFSDGYTAAGSCGGDGCFLIDQFNSRFPRLKRCRKCVLSCFVITSPDSSILFSLTLVFFFSFVRFVLKQKKIEKNKTWRSQLHYEYFLFLRLFVSITLRLMSRFLGFGERFFQIC